MVFSFSLFGREIFRIERLALDAGEYALLGDNSEIDEDVEEDILARTYGFGPPSHYL